MNLDKEIKVFQGFNAAALRFSAAIRGWLDSGAKQSAMAEEIRGMDELLAEQQRVIEERGAIIKVYQGDLQEQSAEVVRMRRALDRLKSERNDWRDRALEYREKMGGQKRRARG